MEGSEKEDPGDMNIFVWIPFSISAFLISIWGMVSVITSSSAQLWEKAGFSMLSIFVIAVIIFAWTRRIRYYGERKRTSRERSK